MHRWLNTLTIMVCLLVMLACGGDTDDRMVRRYAGCHDGHQHHPASHDCVQRQRHCNPLSAEAVEERLRGQLERGEFTMGEIRADYARYCK